LIVENEMSNSLDWSIRYFWYLTKAREKTKVGDDLFYLMKNDFCC